MRIHERRVTAREMVTAKKDCSRITVLSETSDLSSDRDSFYVRLKSVCMKADELSYSNTRTCSSQPWDLTSQEVFPAKGVKKKSCFSRRKIPVAAVNCIYPAQLCLKTSLYSLLKMHSVIYSVLVKPQANFLGQEVPWVS